MSDGRSSPEPGIARSVGQAVGIVWNAIRTPVGPETVEVNRRTETLQQEGGLTLRRTTIDEVVVHPPQPQNP